MSDLRTRIAAIIDREVDGFWEPLDVADAVIRELGLREEHKHRATVQSGPTKRIRYKPTAYRRYVSDWKIEDGITDWMAEN